MTLTVSLLVMAGVALLYALLLYNTSYIRGATYINVLMLNYFWFMASQSPLYYYLWYPNIIENKWVNFGAWCIIWVSLVGVLLKVNKIRTACFLTIGTLNSVFVAYELIRLTKDFPEENRIITVCLFSFLILELQIGAVFKKKYDRPGSFYTRFFAAVILSPLPLAFSMLMFIMKNDTHKVSRDNVLIILIITLAVMAIYFTVATIVDTIVKRRTQEQEERDAARASMRSKISSLVGMQMEKIEDAYSGIRSSAYIVPVHANHARDLYNEAKKLEKNYDGTASGDVLKRLTEIKDELNRIKRFINSGGFSTDSGSGNNTSDTDEYGNSTKNDGNSANKANSGKKSAGGKKSKEDPNKVADDVISAFFNGCETEDEIKKRYHQLSKVFHPDSGSGDEETFMHIREEYDKLLEKVHKEE